MFTVNTSVSSVRYSYHGHIQILSKFRRSLGKMSFMNGYRRCRHVYAIISTILISFTNQRRRVRSIVSSREHSRLTGLVNGAIVKFYGFPEYAHTRDNIITMPKYILVEITKGPGKNIQIPGLPRGVVPLPPVKFWYNTGHGI